MNAVPSQEFRLYRLCLALTVAAGTVFLFLQHRFIPPAHQPLMCGVHAWSIVYPILLWMFFGRTRYRLGVVLLVLIHLATDTVSLFHHPPQYMGPAVLLVYTFIAFFAIVLVAWPEILAVEAALLGTAAFIAFWPGSPFGPSLLHFGLDPIHGATTFLIYLVLILVLGTSLVEVKRRTEGRLRYLNTYLHQLVDAKVAEFKRADREARQVQELLERILLHTSVGVVIFDERLAVHWSNRVHFTTGPENEAHTGRLPFRLLAEVFLGDKAARLLAGGPDLLGQHLEVTAPDGTPRLFRYNFIGIPPEGNERREDGDEARLALITEDITREEFLREQLHQSDRLASLGRMAASLAHEVNNPLAGIKLNLELLRRQRGGGAEEVFAVLEENLTRIDRIVKSFLAFSRQEQPKKTWVDLGAVLAGTLDMALQLRRSEGLEIRRAWDPDVPAVFADQYRLAQVFLNLVNNALDALPASGGRLEVRYERRGDAVRIVVADNGRGIPPEHLKHIFTPFFTTKARGHGTGLGLATSYGIVRDHGGRMEVESRVGRGTTLEVWLPIIGEERHDGEA